MSLHGGDKNKDGKLVKETITRGMGSDGKPNTVANPSYKVTDGKKVETVRK
jgi:hypothetical protein